GRAGEAVRRRRAGRRTYPSVRTVARGPPADPRPQASTHAGLAGAQAPRTDPRDPRRGPGSVCARAGESVDLAPRTRTASARGALRAPTARTLATSLSASATPRSNHRLLGPRWRRQEHSGAGAQSNAR